MGHPPGRRRIRPPLFLLLVLPYGIANGFATVLLPFLITRAGHTVAEAAVVVSLALFPNMLRALIGPVVDLTLTLRRWYGVGAAACAATVRITDLGLAFRYRPGTQTYVGFRTAARAMPATAEAKKEVLMKFGLSEAVLAQFGELLDQFDAATEQCDRGRTAHKGATQQLDELAQELASVVRIMDARNRSRFRDNRGLLESWISASTILGVRRGEGEPVEPPAEGTQGGTPGAGGEVRPAA